MKWIPIVVGAALGLFFVGVGGMYLLDMMPQPEPMPTDTPMGAFLAAFGPTGYMTFVKVCEVVGGALTAIPRTRALGLLVLGPIVVNIFAFQVFVLDGAFLTDWRVLTVGVLTVLAVLLELPRFVRLLQPPRAAERPTA